MAGLVVSKDLLNRELGTALRDLRAVLEHLERIRSWTDQRTEGDLVTLGFTAGEAADLKSAVADMGQLAAIFQGQATLAVAKDFRVFASRLWGLGVAS